MKLEKGTIKYKGKTYPVVNIYFTEEEIVKHGDLQLEPYYTFGTSRIEEGWNEDDNTWSVEQKKVNGQIDCYLDNGDIEMYCNGGIPDSEMKMKLARIIYEYL